MKKTLALILAAVMMFSMTACQKEEEKKTYKIGICQLMPHVALDAASQGFMDALEKALPGQVEFDYKNAGEANNCASIVDTFINNKVDLILANATPALTAAASATKDIPILGTSITAYGVALGIDDFTGTVGGNISGTSDLADLAQQAAMVKEWFPETKTVGLLYCSSEPNSQYQVDEVAKALKEMDIEPTLYSFVDSNDMPAVVEKACDASDVLYIPTDNTAANNTESINNICLERKTPVICGEEGICSGCGVATLSISYYDLGYTTGEMAAKILTGEAKISEMPIEFTTATKKYNSVNCDKLGITPIEGYEAIGD